MSAKPIGLARLPPLTGLNGRMLGDMKKLESLSGPTYLLKNDKYALPPAKSLKPYIDMEAGTIATWPAHASGHATGTTSIQLSKNKSLVVLDDRDMGKPQIIPKPRFLEQLETFLNKELRALGVTTVQPNELRLQAHREVFEYLIEDFKTYKPLLAAIKNEYEMILAFQRQQIRDLEPLKQLLVTVSEQCDQKIIFIREQEKQEMVDLKSENKKLYRRIEELHNVQRDLKEQVNRLQEELQVEYHKYRDECDARKLLVSDINDLRYQQEDYMASKQKAQEDEEEPADPVILKIALKNARDAEKTTSQALNEMVANYCDVIPRRDFESMEKNFMELNEKHSTLQSDFDTLHTEHEALLDVNKQVLQQRDDFYLECETLRQNATPRPDWPKCAEHIQGGLSRWDEVSTGKTSNELVDVLLQEMARGGVIDGAPEYFDGKGTGDDVAQYLRYEGQVRNRQMSKRDCTLLIRDIWKEKTAQDAERTDGTYERMDNFVHGYLKKNFPLEQMTIEWAYNLNDACHRFAQDDVIGLFGGVLANEIDEELYHAQLHTIGSLMEHMDKVISETGGGSEKFTKEGFLQSLQEYFSKFSEQSMLGLLRAAETELEAKDTDEIEYKNLFTEDDEGRTGPFLNEVRRLINELRATFAKEITEQLGDTSPASVDDLKRAITLTDPEVDQAHLDLYLSWVYQVTPETYNNAQPLEKAMIEERLKNGNIERLGKKS